MPRSDLLALTVPRASRWTWEKNGHRSFASPMSQMKKPRLGSCVIYLLTNAQGIGALTPWHLSFFLYFVYIIKQILKPSQGTSLKDPWARTTEGWGRTECGRQGRAVLVWNDSPGQGRAMGGIGTIVKKK